jgi:hypothetical protein
MARQIKDMALMQLAQWERHARDWPLSFARRETGMHLVCYVCRMTILPLDDNRTAYMFTHNVSLAATVAHLRNMHRWIEKEINNGSEDTKTGNGSRGNSSSNICDSDIDRLQTETGPVVPVFTD